MELVCNYEETKNILSDEKQLWKIADSFRLLVCAELRKLESHERYALRGDYLFKIDGNPRFIVIVEESGSWSICISKGLNNLPKFEIDQECNLVISPTQINNIIDGSVRSTILTDSNTLYKLLTGTLKAHVAFVTSKVIINGDLSAFLKMVSLLKRSGVTPKNEKTF